ncbi:hypothetical protein [Methylophilus sp. 14]|uniref:hypothetical protein n=1 Tax=Methylophilus sp. 14 TaxID=2781019 RepID=UPI00188FA0F3|nr:hypothetical protein [Methylophilus sp. 14]MBF4989171.1 hypothetical protein [Methylophilus sp. 14]
MRTLTTAAAMILGLSLALPAQAVETATGETVKNTHHVQFLGQRAYQQPVIAKADAEQAWVGATLRVDQTNQQQTLKLHSLGKRAF